MGALLLPNFSQHEGVGVGLGVGVCEKTSKHDIRGQIEGVTIEKYREREGVCWEGDREKVLPTNQQTDQQIDQRTDEQNNPHLKKNLLLAKNQRQTALE